MTLGFRTRTFLASASNAGVQFMSSIMFAVGGPLFRDQYHLASSDVAIIMAVVIPFSGVVTQVSGCAWSVFSAHPKRESAGGGSVERSAAVAARQEAALYPGGLHRVQSGHAAARLFKLARPGVRRRSRGQDGR
jgi:hypothetical protein